MTNRITRSIAIGLILILGWESNISLAANAHAGNKQKKSVYYPLLAGKSSSSGKTKPRVVRVQATNVLPGQTVTLLPDGRSLLIGGESENGTAFGDDVAEWPCAYLWWR